jgi:membrane protease YdiL (CAAX protease family)
VPSSKATNPQHELRPLGALLLVLVQFSTFMTVLLVAVMLQEMRSEEGSALLVGKWNLVAATVVGPLVALYVGLNRYAGETTTRRALGLGRPTGRQVACAVAAAAGGVLLAPLWRASQVEPVSAVLLVVAYPAANELLYRGFVQRRLTDSVGAWRALAVTFTLFVVGHLNPYVMPGAALIGGFTGIAAWRSGSTWVPLAAHLGFQASRLMLGERLPALVAVGAAAALAAVWAIGKPEAA